MTIARHRDFRLQRLRIGREQAPLVVIDNVVADPEDLVNVAATKQFGEVASYYPGVRAKVALSYQQFILEQLRSVFAEEFAFASGAVRFTACHYSLVTTPPDKLTYLQRVPHIDSVASKELAFIHYLFKAELGGTAFYRHRKTGFEYVDEGRKAEYLRCLEDEKVGPHSPPAEYINGDTALYERLDHHPGVFNRLLMYRRNSLHSGALSRNFAADANPLTGRLSINGFLA
jgi:Family of unknown function (DUF6445)